jgi:hypothetical protein
MLTALAANRSGQHQSPAEYVPQTRARKRYDAGQAS